MGIFDLNHPLEFAFGLLGNLASFMVYVAPVPTFYRVYKKKSTEGFHSIPYVVALFSAMLWMYYAYFKTNEYLLITINSFGCAVESIYISMFIAYATRQGRILTFKWVGMVNIGVFSLIVLSSLLLTKGEKRVTLLGWICVVFSASVFAAPLSIVRVVIRTKSVEFLPFWLSFFLTLSAVSWFSYGFMLKDIYVAIPNILGFMFGVIQMILFAVYRKNTKRILEMRKETEKNVEVITTNPIAKCQDNVKDVQPNPEEHVISVQPKPEEAEENDTEEETGKRETVVPYPMELKLHVAPIPMKNYPTMPSIEVA